MQQYNYIRFSSSISFPISKIINSSPNTGYIPRAPVIMLFSLMEQFDIWTCLINSDILLLVGIIITWKLTLVDGWPHINSLNIQIETKNGSGLLLTLLLCYNGIGCKLSQTVLHLSLHQEKIYSSC